MATVVAVRRLLALVSCCTRQPRSAFRTRVRCTCMSDRATSRKLNENISEREKGRIRNVGVMAHIDAGKTTTTERMLYYAGFTRHMGDVDDGDTVMDFMKQERERGITINSASISFFWNEHRINLIDTPGHVDFTFEVERSLCVLDGAVALFDGSSGVEAQTVSVWRQADRYCVPRIAYINKMDKPRASLQFTVDSMRTKLSATPITTQLPVGTGSDFRGVFDLVAMELLLWKQHSDGLEYEQLSLACPPSSEGEEEEKDMFVQRNSSLPVGRDILKDVYCSRIALVEQLAMFDNQLLESILSGSASHLALDSCTLKSSIRRLTHESKAVPVLCGSALKNKGIQPLIDAIIDYLPHPAERYVTIPDSLKQLFAFAFKVTHDPKRGPLVYLRVYAGAVESHSVIYNITRHKEERVSRVLLMLANEQKEVSRMSEGNIAVVVGLKHTVTGDTIVRSAAAAKQAVREEHRAGEGGEGRQLVLPGPPVPEPMFFCTIEPESAAYQNELEHALMCLSREDPSLRVSTDEDTGQTILSGMGELHLEVVLDRIRRDYRVQANIGKLQVSYREAPSRSSTQSDSLERTFGSQSHSISVTLTVNPSTSTGRVPKVDVPPSSSLTLPPSMTREEAISAVCNGVEMACLNGPILGFPVCQTNVSLSSLSVATGTSLAMLSSCVTQCISKALSRAGMMLLEPVVQLVVTVPEDHLNAVISDLTSTRRALLSEVTSHGDTRIVTALTPVASLTDYSSAVRTVSSGTASFTSQFSHYEPLNKTQEMEVIQTIQAPPQGLVSKYTNKKAH